MKRLFRLLGFIILCLGCLFAALLAQPAFWLARAQTRQRAVVRLTQSWARLALWLLNFKVTPAGLAHCKPDQHYLLVCNHQSYLDILLIAAYLPAQFVAKVEVQRWPVLGWLAQLGGTVFIDRHNTHSNVQGVYRVSRALRAGLSVQVFPESTTSDGTRMLPFKPLFLAAAVRACTPVLPLTINYTSVNGAPLDAQTRDWLCWYGEMEFVRHFWHLLSLRTATADVIVHEPLSVNRRVQPQALTLQAQNCCASRFAWPYHTPPAFNQAAPTERYPVLGPSLEQQS